MTERIPHSRPSRAAGDLEAVARVLESGWLAGGPEVRALEAEAARTAGRRFGVAVSSGSAALHVALLALQTRPGDRVAVPSYACTALLQAVRRVGAREALADCAPGSLNLDPASPALGGARAVILPHLCGFPAEAGRVIERARAERARVVEDCAMAAGAMVEGRPAGAAGDLAIFSFYATKLVTCGQGGMLVGDDPELESRARDLLAHDEREDFRPRFNYGLTDLQAALARRQWAELPRWVERRRELAARYGRSLDLAALEAAGGGGPPGEDPRDARGSRPCWYRYPVDLGGARLRERVQSALLEEGIEAKSPVFRPLHRYLGLPDSDFPRAARLQDGLLSIPLYPSLSDGEADRVVEALNRAVRRG